MVALSAALLASSAASWGGVERALGDGEGGAAAVLVALGAIMAAAGLRASVVGAWVSSA